jgi:anti-sigma28 factor (negative regulator of flagellin synthesis)
MRINSIPPKELYYQLVHVREKPTQVQPYQTTDKVELTSEAKTFSTAFKAAKEAMETRSPAETNRIEQVKQQVQNNTYSVSGYNVASKILGQ